MNKQELPYKRIGKTLWFRSDQQKRENGVDDFYRRRNFWNFWDIIKANSFYIGVSAMNESEEIGRLIERLFALPEGPGHYPFMSLSLGARIVVSCDGESYVLNREEKGIKITRDTRDSLIRIDIHGLENLRSLAGCGHPHELGTKLLAMHRGGGIRLDMLCPFTEQLRGGIPGVFARLGYLADLDREAELTPLQRIAFTHIIDVDYLQELVDEFASLSGLRLWVIDVNSIPVAFSGSYGDHCWLIINCLEGAFRCFMSAIGSMDEILRHPRPRIRTCHAGFTCFDAPMILGGEVVGMISGDASVPARPDPEYYRELAGELGIDPGALLSSLERVRYVGEDDMRLLSRIMEMLGRVITEMSYKQYLLSNKIDELHSLNRISGMLSAHLPDRLHEAFPLVAEETASLQGGVGCRVEVDDGEGPARQYTFTGDEAEGETRVREVELKERGSKAGRISLRYVKESGSHTYEDGDYLDTVSGQLALAVMNSRLYRDLQRKNRELHELLSQVIYLQEKERSAIARELHDDAAQNLTRVLLFLRMALGKDGLSKNVTSLLLSAEEGTSSSLRALRDIASGLHPHVLDDLGLRDAVEGLVKRMSRDYPVALMSDVQGEEGEIPFEVKINVFRIIQEALSNVVKHAGAREAMISIDFMPDGIEVKVRDDGRGMDGSPRGDRAHLGLATMRERAELLGGELEVSSAPGEGTLVYLQVPKRNEEGYGRQ